ncbi:hypothetical protein A2335_01400 [Candidatus Peregrinibacteria bacterium RIFOXYB2_FULL_32_7]|nr:MAG: hypothetical protein A2335_01400 [Candidatus Peregrinibacteria bacterium RIFOXYB2_FULL_32_7]
MAIGAEITSCSVPEFMQIKGKAVFVDARPSVEQNTGALDLPCTVNVQNSLIAPNTIEEIRQKLKGTEIRRIVVTASTPEKATEVAERIREQLSVAIPLKISVLDGSVDKLKLRGAQMKPRFELTGSNNAEQQTVN